MAVLSPRKKRRGSTSAGAIDVGPDILSLQDEISNLTFANQRQEQNILGMRESIGMQNANIQSQRDIIKSQGVQIREQQIEVLSILGADTGPKFTLLNPLSSDHYVNNLSTFTARIRLNRSGKKELSSVRLNGEVPTRHNTDNQGPHIVARGLAYRALRKLLQFQPINKAIDNLIMFTNNIPNLAEDANFERDLFRVGNGQVISERKKTDKGGIIEYLGRLKERSNKMFLLKNFNRTVNDGGAERQQDDLKSAVRQNMELLRTDIAFITTDIVRLWNQREYNVWDERTRTPTTGLKAEEEKFATELQKGGAGERKALEDLDKNENIYESLAKLIDIRPTEALAVSTSDEDKKKYKLIRKIAVKEAMTLYKYAYDGGVNETMLNEAIETKRWRKKKVKTNKEQQKKS
jgi:hypothetical protein